jgi:predicted aspartyl protease
MVPMTLTNNSDLQQAERGWMSRDRVRRVTAPGLLDTGASGLILPADLVRRLGLPSRGMRKVRYADGRIVHVPWVSGVRIEVLGRETTCDAMVHAAGTTPLIGKSTMDAMGLTWEAAAGTPTVMRSSVSLPVGPVRSSQTAASSASARPGPGSSRGLPVSGPGMGAGRRR